MQFEKTKFFGFIFSGWTAIILLSCSLLSLWARIGSVPDGDVFFLITSGRDILRTGTIPHVLLHTVHDGFHTVIQQYAACIISAFIYDHIGMYGIVLFALFTGFISLFLVYLFIRRHLSSASLRIFAFSFIAMHASTFFYPRPWSYTIVNMLIVLNVADLYLIDRNRLERHLIWLLPVISVIQINIHASMWYIVVFTAFLCLIPPFDPAFSHVSLMKWISDARFLFISVLLMIPCGLITPYGAEALLYLPLSYGQAAASGMIMELAMPVVFSSFGACIIFCSVILIFCIRKKHCIDSAFMLGVFGILLAGLHKRDIFILCIYILPSLCTFLDSYEGDADNYGTKHKYIGNIVSIIAAVFIVTSVFKVSHAESKGQLHPDSSCYPVEAADCLDDMGAGGSRIFTTFNTGAYMEFRGYLVYLDSRPELFQKSINGVKDVYDEFLDISYGDDYDYAAFLSQYDFDYFLVPRDHLISSYLRHSGSFDIVYEDKDYTVFGNAIDE